MTPAPTNRDAYLDPYREAVMRHGPSFEATLWGSREAQQLRFDVMIDLSSAEQAGFDQCSILDVGCGQGDFAQRLLERQVDFAGYLGLDAIEAMVESAGRRALDPQRGRVRFEAADVVAHPAILRREPFDYICISGTLNTMEEPLARTLVQRSFEAAAKGVIFNFLSDRCPKEMTKRDLWPARRFDTLSWLDWALDLTSRVGFRQDYLDGHDATIIIGRMIGHGNRHGNRHGIRHGNRHD